jgi:hypothetical protein
MAQVFVPFPSNELLSLTRLDIPGRFPLQGDQAQVLVSDLP